MSTDERDFARELREEADSKYNNPHRDWLLKEAADEIDRLKAVALRAPEAADAGAVAWIDEAALQAAHEIVALSETWTYTRRKAVIQVIVAREMRRALSPTAAGIAAPPAASADAVREQIAAIVEQYIWTDPSAGSTWTDACSAAEKILALPALSAPVAGADRLYTREELEQYRDCPNHLEPEDCRSSCGEKCVGRDAGMRDQSGDELSATSYEGREVTLRHDTIINGVRHDAGTYRMQRVGPPVEEPQF